MLKKLSIHRRKGLCASGKSEKSCWVGLVSTFENATNFSNYDKSPKQDKTMQILISNILMIWANFVRYSALQTYVGNKNRNTVDSRLFEPALIRIIRLFEVRWRSPWICLPNSGKNTLGYSNFSYSNFQLFEAISIPLGTNYSLNHPQLFEFFLFGDRRVRPLIFCD